MPRVKILLNGAGANSGKVVALPGTIDELLTKCSQKFSTDVAPFVAAKLFTRDGFEVDEIEAEGVTLDDSQTYSNTRTNLFRTAPARFAVRPHLGVDFDLGALSIAAQLDIAFLNNEQLSTEVDTSALSDFDPEQEGGMFGDAQQDSQTSAALVGSLAMRVVF